MVGIDVALVLAALAAAVPPPEPPPAPPPPEPAHRRPAVSDRPARTVGQAIRRAHLKGAITWTERRRYERELSVAKRAARRLPALRARELRGALVQAKHLAADGRLGAERLTGVIAAIRATRWTMTTQRLPVPAERITLPRDGLVYEFRPRYGVQPHPLATAGRVNALATACLHETKEARCRPAALDRAASALVKLGVRSGRTLRLEYLYPFGRGHPPWSSSMAQATTAQALARTARATGDRRYARNATAAYRALVGPATAVRTDAGRVRRFAMYSFQPSMRVLNGELQTLVGLADYARISGNRSARRVLRRTARTLAGDLGAWDTGAWTLYSAGGREATLHYHELAAQFAARACDRRLAGGFCPAARRYARYTVERPRLHITATDIVRAPRRITVRLRASKLTTGTFVARGPGDFEFRRSVTLGRQATTFKVPIRREGRFRLTVSGTAVNGKRDVARALVRARPRPKPKHKRAGKHRKGAADRARD